MLNLELIMTPNPVTVTPSTSVDEARKIMQRHRFRHLPVVNDNGQLVGLITQTDVLAATDSFLRTSDSRMPVPHFPVEDVMVTELMTVDERISVRQAALLIEKHRIGCLPVVTEGRLVGIITDTDFVGVAINLLELIEESELEPEG